MKPFRWALLVALLAINILLLSFLATTSRIVANDEARAIMAGVSYRLRGEFGLANDSPPLSRLVAVLPLLPLNVECEAPASAEAAGHQGSEVWEHELIQAGRFGHINEGVFNLQCLARMTGCLWWFVGAWVVFQWSSRLYGNLAGYLGVILWSLLPNVLEQEQFATPWLPAAVTCAAATYAFRGYLVTPTWEKALVAGLLLGVALLTEFVALALLVIWPLLVFIDRLTREDRASPQVAPRIRILHAAVAMATALWMINLGYGFEGSGSRLGSIDFASRILSEPRRPPDHGAAVMDGGNRFRGTWLGRVIIPLPADYLKGLDRRWHEREVVLHRRGAGEGLREVDCDSLSRVTGTVPMGVWAMMLASLCLLLRRHPSGAPLPWGRDSAGGRGEGESVWAEELTLWLPAVLFLALAVGPLGLIPSAVGTLLVTPLLVIIATKLAAFLYPWRWKAGGLALALTVWSIGTCLIATSRAFFTPARTTLFRQDLVRQGRKLGLTLPEPRTSHGAGREERGLLFRTFIDSRGTQVNYALFVPRDYRGDRPYPLILFLHGWGDRGTAAADHKYTEVGLPFTLKYRWIDFFVLCPQAHSGTWEANGDDARGAMELLAAVQDEYRIDPRRIILSGLSSGGTGVWNLAAAYPGRWAALVPVAGGGDPSQVAVVKDIPCWCFHNRYDGDIPADSPRAMIAALRALGARPNYTEYPETGHRAWERAYVLPELYDWLARQRRP